jgi:hypothetical protein
MQMMLSANAALGAPNVPTQNLLYQNAQAAQAKPGFLGTLPSGMLGALPLADPADTFGQFINAATPTGADQAERNIANAISTTQVPAGAVVNAGGHWDAVWGVYSSAAPAVNQPYTIYGFAVADPWTGYALAHPSLGQSLGLGIAYVSNYTTSYLLPNRAVISYNPFLSVFTPETGVRINPWFGNYVSVTDPLGPPAPDNGSNNSIPTNTQITLSTATAITASQAVTDATTDSTNGSVNLSTEPGFGAGDQADPNLADILQVAQPGGSGVDDFLVPFEDTNGTPGSNFTGIESINEYTGQIDFAQSFVGGSELTLAQIQALGTDLLSGNVPQDNLPEPSALAMLALGGLVLVARRRVAGVKSYTRPWTRLVRRQIIRSPRHSRKLRSAAGHAADFCGS